MRKSFNRIGHLIAIVFVFSILSLPLITSSNAQDAVPPAPGGVTAPVEGSQPQGGLLMNLMPMLMVVGIFWLLVFRPQMKQAKEKAEMVNQLKEGDDVVTSSGILGKITGIADKVVTVEIANNVRVKVLKSQIGQVVKQGKLNEPAST